MIELTLPYPPSANRLWRSVNGRNIKSREYRQWEQEALGMIAAARVKRIKGQYILSIIASRPDKRRRDLGNLEKPISDVLETGGAVSDDCLASEIHLYWNGPGKDVLVKVEAANA